jgi:hypothetical protein
MNSGIGGVRVVSIVRVRPEELATQQAARNRSATDSSTVFFVRRIAKSYLRFVLGWIGNPSYGNLYRRANTDGRRPRCLQNL